MNLMKGRTKNFSNLAVQYHQWEKIEIVNPAEVLGQNLAIAKDFRNYAVLPKTSKNTKMVDLMIKYHKHGPGLIQNPLNKNAFFRGMLYGTPITDYFGANGKIPKEVSLGLSSTTKKCQNGWIWLSVIPNIIQWLKTKPFKPKWITLRDHGEWKMR